MADDNYTPAPPVDDSVEGSPEYQDPGSGPVAAPSMQDMLSGAPAQGMPDLGTPGQAPRYAGNIDGQTGQAIPPQNKWERLFQTIAVGLSGGAGAKNFAQGVEGGARASLENQQLQKQNAVQQQELAVRQQQSMDSHQLAQAQLATTHLNQQVLAAQYNTMPKSTQDILDQVMYKQGAELQGDANAKNVFTGSYNDALARAQAEMTQKGQNSPLAVRVLKNPNGTFSTWDVAAPDKLNDKPWDVVIGQDFNTGKPVTKTYAPGTITYAQKANMETTAAMNMAQANNQLEVHKKMTAIDTAAAGQKAFLEEQGRNKADLQAIGGQQDDFGNQVTPAPGGIKQAAKLQVAFKKNADDLSKTEQTFRQFNSILNDINAGKDMTGAQSVVALFNSIGISATPLKGMGFRINNSTVEEHSNARGLGQTLYQKLLSLKDGDVITPQQVKDYASLAMDARKSAYVTNYNEARSMGVNPRFLLPKGNGQKPDPNTIQIFGELAGGDPKKAATALANNGWK